MSQVLPQQDFFMYMPKLCEMGIFPMVADKECSGVKSGEGYGILPSVHADWVKIPLEGQVVVYAHVWNGEE